MKLQGFRAYLALVSVGEQTLQGKTREESVFNWPFGRLQFWSYFEKLCGRNERPGERKAGMQGSRIHPHRTIGRHRDHCHSGGNVTAGSEQGKRSSQTNPVRVQPTTSGAGDVALPG